MRKGKMGDGGGGAPALQSCYLKWVRFSYF